METIESFSGDIDRCHESKCQFGSGKIIVDRLWDPDHRKAPLVKLLGDRQCTFSTQYQERFDSEDIQICKGLADRHLGVYLLAVNHFDKAAAISSSQDRATARE